MADIRYTFISFCLDFVYILRSLFGGKFIECFHKCIFVMNMTINYLFYRAMCYVGDQYDIGNFRLSDQDYTNKNYIPDPLKRPYHNIQVGLRPTNYTDFSYILIQLFWVSILTYLMRNPIPCLILYVIYNYFPWLTLFFEICLVIYVAYNLFDK